MKIGIIGAGKMGAAIGILWAQKGHQVRFSYSRKAEKLEALANLNENTSQGSVAEAISFGEVVLLAVPFSSLEEILAQKVLFKGKTVITCISGLVPDFSGETIGLPSQRILSVAEQISLTLDESSVVEAFNTTFAEILQLPSRVVAGQKASIFYCGDDQEAKRVVASLIEDCDYRAVNAGNLYAARALETFATSWVQFAVVAGFFPRISIRAIQF